MGNYTLVQHSGYGYAGKEGFLRAVETRRITSSREHAAIEKAGGLLLGTYTEAEDAAENENYPAGLEGLYPRVNGNFSTKIKVDGLALYLPVKVDA